MCSLTHCVVIQVLACLLDPRRIKPHPTSAGAPLGCCSIALVLLSKAQRRSFCPQLPRHSSSLGGRDYSCLSCMLPIRPPIHPSIRPPIHPSLSPQHSGTCRPQTVLAGIWQPAADHLLARLDCCLPGPAPALQWDEQLSTLLLLTWSGEQVGNTKPFEKW